MKNFIFGAIVTALLVSVSMNIAQYTGKLGSPQAFTVVPTDDQKLAAIYGGM